MKSFTRLMAEQQRRDRTVMSRAKLPRVCCGCDEIHTQRKLKVTPAVGGCTRSPQIGRRRKSSIKREGVASCSWRWMHALPGSWLECGIEVSPPQLWIETWPEPSFPSPSGQAGPLSVCPGLPRQQCRWSGQVDPW